MELEEAIKSCREGNFVTHRAFDSTQSMHAYKGELYYEDGANLSNQMDWIESQKLFEEGWHVKFISEHVNKDNLREMHMRNKRYMLIDCSYEECINR